MTLTKQYTPDEMKAFREGREEFVEMQKEHDEPEYNSFGQLLRPHYCVHGTNQWTDYDNICHYCEDSIIFPVQWGMIRMWQYITMKEREKKIQDGVDKLSLELGKFFNLR